MNANEFFQSMQTLNTRYFEEYTRAMQRYTEAFNSVAQVTPNRGSTPTLGDFTQISDMQKRYADFVLSESPKVFAKVTEASINYYSTLADLSLQSFNGYVDSVVATMESPTKNSRGATTHNSGGLLFHGVSGQSASNAFLISNHRDEAIDVKFNMPTITNPKTGATFKPSAKFTPAKCRLSANSERVIQCTVQLDKEFESNQTYEGSIAVDNFPEMAMTISVQVEEGVNKQAASKGKRNASKKKKVTKKKSSKR